LTSALNPPSPVAEALGESPTGAEPPCLETQAESAQAQLARYAVQLLGLAEASLAAQEDLSGDVLLRVIAEHTRRIFRAQHAVATVLGGGQEIRIVHARAPQPDFAPPCLVLEPSARPFQGTACLTRDELLASPDHLRLLESANLAPPDRHWLGAPIVSRDGRVRGLIHLLDPECIPAREREEVVLAQVARMAASALENVRLYHSAREAIRARDEVLAVVSHDLRNPLNVILMTASLLLQQNARVTAPGEGERKMRVALERIQRSAKQMALLVRDLLDANRIEAGALVLEPESHTALALLEEALDAIRPLASEKGVKLLGAPPPRWLRVLADRSRLLQVFSNLLGNAIKFTPAGGEVSVSVQRVEEGVRFSVKDTGPGIPPENLPRLFDRYWQAPATAKLGSGLGLFIAKGIVEAHGGTLCVKSQPGDGSVFTFTVPRDDAEPGL